MIEELDQLLSARKGLAQAIASLGLQARELPHAAPTLDVALESLRVQQKQIDAQIRQLTQREASLELSQRLQAVPGIGPVVAATLASRLAARSLASSDAGCPLGGLLIAVWILACGNRARKAATPA